MSPRGAARGTNRTSCARSCGRAGRSRGSARIRAARTSAALRPSNPAATAAYRVRRCREPPRTVSSPAAGGAGCQRRRARPGEPREGPRYPWGERRAGRPGRVGASAGDAIAVRSLSSQSWRRKRGTFGGLVPGEEVHAAVAPGGGLDIEAEDSLEGTGRRLQREQEDGGPPVSGCTGTTTMFSRVHVCPIHARRRHSHFPHEWRLAGCSTLNSFADSSSLSRLTI